MLIHEFANTASLEERYFVLSLVWYNVFFHNDIESNEKEIKYQRLAKKKTKVIISIDTVA